MPQKLPDYLNDIRKRLSDMGNAAKQMQIQPQPPLQPPPPPAPVSAQPVNPFRTATTGTTIGKVAPFPMQQPIPPPPPPPAQMPPITPSMSKAALLPGQEYPEWDKPQGDTTITPAGQSLIKGISGVAQTVAAPSTVTGMGVYSGLQALKNPPKIGKNEPQAMPEQKVNAYKMAQPLYGGEYAVGGQKFEEYQKQPFIAKFAYELPALVALGVGYSITPGATGASKILEETARGEGNKAILAQMGQSALAPFAAVETISNKVLNAVLGKPMGWISKQLGTKPTQWTDEQFSDYLANKAFKESPMYQEFVKYRPNDKAVEAELIKAFKMAGTNGDTSSNILNNIYNSYPAIKPDPSGTKALTIYTGLQFTPEEQVIINTMPIVNTVNSATKNAPQPIVSGMAELTKAVLSREMPSNAVTSAVVNSYVPKGLTITPNLVSELLKQGFSQQAISDMSPARAWANLFQQPMAGGLPAGGMPQPEQNVPPVTNQATNVTQPPIPARKPVWQGKTDVTAQSPVPPTQPSGGNVPPKFPSGRVPGGIWNQSPLNPEDNYQMLVDALEPKQSALRDRVTESKDWLMRHFYDRNYPLKQLETESGIPAHKLAQIVPGSTAAGEDLIRQHFRPIWQPIQKDVKYLEQHMVLMRDLDILARNPSARLPGNVQGYGGIQQAQDSLKKIIGGDRYAAIEKAATELWKANDEYVLKPLLDEGILDKEGYTAIKSSHPHYIPFMRSDFTENIGRHFTRPEASLSKTGIAKMDLSGSERALDNPLARLEAGAIKTQNYIFRNRAAKSIVEALQATDPSLVTYIEPKGELSLRTKVTGETVQRAAKSEHSSAVDTVSFFKDGKKYIVEIPAVYAQVAKGMESESANPLSRILSATSAPLRAGAVQYNPAFIPVNTIRDAMSAFYREKLIPFSPEYVRGWMAAIAKNSDFSDAAQSGVLMSGIVETMTSTDAMKRVQKLGGIQIHNPKDALLVIPRLISAANETAERATRIATFIKLKGEGIPNLEAAVRSRDVTVDFSKAGTTMKFINQAIPFSNAGVQGTANLIRTIRDKPAWAAVALAPLAVATALSRLNNKRYDTSKDIPGYEYTNNWVFQVGEGTKKDGTKFPVYIKIPKGQIGSMATFPIEAIFTYTDRQDDRSGAEILLDAGIEALKSASPIEPSVSGVLPPLLQTGVGLSTGVDPYSNMPIVSQSQQNLLPEQQFDDTTSKAAIALGQSSKISPKKIDYAIKSYLAGAGETASWLFDGALGILGYNPEPYGGSKETTPLETATQNPVIRRFVGTKNNQQERVGWDTFNKVVTQTNREFSKLPEVNKLGIRLGSVGSSINNNELTPAQMAEYQQMMAEAVTPALKAYISSIKGVSDTKKRELIADRMAALKSTARTIYARSIGLATTTTPVSPPSTTQPYRSSTSSRPTNPFSAGSTSGSARSSQPTNPFR